MKTKAFLLFGGFTSGRYPEFLASLTRRGLVPLVIDESNPRTLLNLKAMENDSSHPFQHFADFVFVDPQEPIGILGQVRQWLRTYDIQGVYTIREAFVEAVGRVGDWLGLPHVGLRASEVCRNKFLQRLYLSDLSPKFSIILPEMRSDVGEKWNHFPAVVKPLNRQASRGVQRVDDKEVLRRVLHSDTYNPGESLLLEELVAGPEFSVETLVQRGRIIFAGITQKRTNSDFSEFFVEMAHTLPAIDLSIGEREGLLRTNAVMIERLGIENGITHAEYKISPTNRSILMEVAARNPGDGILPLYQLATGVPLENAVIGIALGEPTTYPELVRYARQVYFHHRLGELADVRIQGDDIPLTWYRSGEARSLLVPSNEMVPVLREVVMDKQPGDFLGAIKESSDRSGSYLFDAPDSDMLDDAEIAFGHKIEVVVRES